MNSPVLYDDGSVRLPFQTGATTYASPFAKEGDSVSWIAYATFVQDARFYKAKAIGSIVTFPRGAAYLCDISPTSDNGCGELTWQETYAPVPQSRTTYNSTVYTQQFIRVFQPSEGGIAQYSVLEWTNTRDAKTIYDYSFQKPLPRILAPKAIQQENQIYLEGGFGTFSEGQSILARDTESEIWMGLIFVRKSVMVDYHNFVQLQ